MIRLGGGHAAAYGPGCLIHEEIVPHRSTLEGLQERYAQETTLVRRRCWRSAPRSVVGALEGEYCAGAHSLHAGGVKVAGIAQRVVKGAALISSAVLVDAGPSLRAVLVDVYAALGIDWRPQTAGSLADVAPAPRARGGGRARSRPAAPGPAASSDEDLRRAPSWSRSTGRRLAACATCTTSRTGCRR